MTETKAMKTEDEASAVEETVEEAPKAPALAMIHVRFSPDGSVIEIGARPPSLTPQDWFDRLSEKAGTHYQPLSGGRGLFRLPPDEVETLNTMSAN
jgi:hypothetical protein